MTLQQEEGVGKQPIVFSVFKWEWWKVDVLLLAYWKAFHDNNNSSSSSDGGGPRRDVLLRIKRSGRRSGC